MRHSSFSPRRTPPTLLKLTCALVLCFAGTASAQARHEIDNLLSQAMTSNPSIAVAEAQRRGAELDVDVARLQRWPNLSVTAEAADSNPGSYLNVEQPLWTGGALTAGIRASERQFDAAGAYSDVERLRIGLRVIDAWQTLRQANSSLLAQEESLRNYDRFEAMMRRRVETEVSPGIDLSQLLARIDQMQAQASESRVQIRINQARLEQISGQSLAARRIEELLAPVDESVLDQWSTPAKLEQLLGQVADTATVRKARYDAEASNEQLKIKKAQNWPRLAANLRHQLTGDPADGQDRNRVWLGLSYAPGAGFSSYTQARADAERHAATLAGVEVASKDIAEALKVDWETLARAQERKATLQRAIDGSKDIVASYERQFVAGRKTWLDVLNALRELSQNQISLGEARAAAVASYYRLRLRGGDGFQNR